MSEIESRLARMIERRIANLTSLDSPHYRGTLAEIAHSRSTVFALIDAYIELFGFDATSMGSGWYNRAVKASKALEDRVRGNRGRPAAATVFASTTGEGR